MHERREKPRHSDDAREARSREERLRVLFLGTGNSCRSQMAEGWARALKAEAIEPCSAGIEKHGMNPRAMKVMAEAGVDISGQYSKTTDGLGDIEFDYVVTVCDRARESCPLFLGNAKVIHVGFDDPPALAKDAASEEEALLHYRRVRDKIRAFVEKMPEVLEDSVQSLLTR
jgi:arsenate reductase